MPYKISPSQKTFPSLDRNTMKLYDILSKYPIETIERLAKTRVDDIALIRLPLDVLINELCNVLNSASYVAGELAFRHPPYCGLLLTLMETKEYSSIVVGFKDIVEKRTADLCQMAARGEGLFPGKNYDLYRKMIAIAWESEKTIDSSEAALLDALRQELGITIREHLVIEHHPALKCYWEDPRCYERERNALLASGILHSIDNGYILAEETVSIIRQIWNIELDDSTYRRLLSYLTNAELYDVLKSFDLKVSGTNEEKINAVMDNQVTPRVLLETLNLVPTLRELAGRIGYKVSGTKPELIDGIIDFFDTGKDLQIKEEVSKDDEPELEPEPKELKEHEFCALFKKFSNHALYDILRRAKKLRKSGAKDQRMETLWKSPYSEATLLDCLRKEELIFALKKCGQRFSGPKTEQIKRLVEAHKGLLQSETENVSEVINLEQAVILAKEEAEIADPESEVIEDVKKPDMNEVIHTYPFLDKNEALVFYHIRELRSINDIELDRIIARYDINWFLPRAHMRELLAKIEENRAPMVRLRSVGEHNIYEYIG